MSRRILYSIFTLALITGLVLSLWLIAAAVLAAWQPVG